MNNNSTMTSMENQYSFDCRELWLTFFVDCSEREVGTPGLAFI